MQVMMTVQESGSGRPLFQVVVDGEGRWRYESQAVQRAEGRLAEGERAQLISLLKKVAWDREQPMHPRRREDHLRFRLEVAPTDGEGRTFTFSDTMEGISVELRDLVHYLRHNLAVGGDPVGPEPDQLPHQPNL